MTGTRLLEGIRVADMSTVLFGPYCTQLLADMGADVVKVEPPTGDIGRTLGRSAHTKRMGQIHMNINRGKRSVVWDLRTEDGRKALAALLVRSDVFIHNIRGDAICSLGFDYESVRALNPTIVYVHCTGFASDGPRAGAPAYDDIIQASSGMADLLPRADGNPDPRYLPTAIADKVSGMTAAYATLAALIHKLRTGEGQHIEVPMFETITAFTLLEHLAGRTFVPPNGPMGYTRQFERDRQPTRTSDGHISIAPYTYERWVVFFEKTGHGAVMQHPDLATRALAEKNVALLYRKLAEITPARSTAEWLAFCETHDIPAMRVNRLDDLFDDPQLSATGFLATRSHPSEGDYVEIASSVRFSAHPDRKPGFAPLLGEHTRAVEAELGLAPSSPRESGTA